MTVASNIKSSLPKIESVEKFTGLVGECSQTIDKSLARTLMSTLTTISLMVYVLCMNIIDMTNIATRLKTLGMTVNEDFLIRFILNSLSSEYGLFQMSYNTMKDKMKCS